MLNFAKQAQITQKANEMMDSILAKQDDMFNRNKAINSIEDLAVAKEVIKRLLDKINT